MGVGRKGGIIKEAGLRAGEECVDPRICSNLALVCMKVSLEWAYTAVPVPLLGTGQMAEHLVHRNHRPISVMVSNK